MFHLSRPSSAQIDRVVASCAERRPNHPLLADADLTCPPDGFRRDHASADLGCGERAWDTACAALDAGAMYPPGWASVHGDGGGAVVGAPLVSVLRHLGFWSIQPGRIRRVLDDRDGPRLRHGFSFLTLDGHAERGVERFLVTWNTDDDSVRYDLDAISRPAGVVRLGAPIARVLQRRFRRDSVEAMERAVRTSAGPVDV